MSGKPGGDKHLISARRAKSYRVRAKLPEPQFPAMQYHIPRHTV